jgi:Flp pilus assembly protein TadD, contains TPR repeats
MEAVAVEQIPFSLRESMARFAITEIEKSMLENPLDPRPKLFLAAAYRRFGDTDAALRTLAEAQALSPKKQQIFFEIADTYIQRSEFGKALAAFEEAFALAPEFVTARINLAAGYIFNDEQAKADALLREGFGTEIIVDELLIQVYSMVRDYERLIKTLEVLLAEQPTVDNYRRLAGAHMFFGNQAAAIAVLEEAIEKFPGFAEEGNGYINDIQG